MREEFKPAIEALQADLADLEKQVLETKLVINRLCVRSGMEPLYPDASATRSSTMSTVRPDSFYGKSITTAARDFLEMRRSAGLGPATPREVYEALIKGGYTFEAREEVTAIIGLRATLRKSSAIFHRLPNGTYGLLSWYPNAKPSRDGEDDEEPRPRASKRGQQRSSRSSRKANVRAASKKMTAKTSESGSKVEKIRTALSSFLADGPKKRTEILDHLTKHGIMGHETDPLGNLAGYLSRSKDLVSNDGEGNWSLAGQKE